MAPCDQAALGLLEYRDVPGKMREATAGVTAPLRRLLGHHPAGEHRDEAIRQVCAIARRYQRVVEVHYDPFSLSPRNAVSALASRQIQQ
jgi:hypothetical protein